MSAREAERVHPLTLADWRAWLEREHARAAGAWFVSYKKGAGKPRVEYDYAVEAALCFGWVDSKANALDDERSMLWFAPRKAGSGWSALNKARVERLIARSVLRGACRAPSAGPPQARRARSVLLRRRILRVHRRIRRRRATSGSPA